ncbi:MAG: glycosyltransferase family 4 protein [Candidatus Methylomirabilia bacterium]
MSGQKLRILHIYPKADYFTGAAIQLHDLARALVARGHRVAVVTRPSDIWARRCREANIPYYSLPMRSELDARSVAGLFRILRSERAEVVHCHKGRARTLAILAGLFVKVPVLILNRGVSFPLGPFNRLGYTTRRLTTIVAVSHSIKRGLVSQGVPAEKIEVIHSGTDTDRFHPSLDGSSVRAELGLTPQDFLVTQVGVRSWRGNDDVLEAMRLVARAAPRPRLLIVGARGPDALYEKARVRGLNGRVYVFGYRKDIHQILAASDLTVDAPYAGVGLTGSLRESLAVETPVIGTDVAGIPELIQDGETGLLVSPHNPEALAQAILRIMEDPVKAKEMARAGRKLVETEFSMRAKTERTEALYSRLLAERR